MPLIRVVATGSDPVPMELMMGWIRKDPVQVEDTPFYRRMIADGALSIAPEISVSLSAADHVQVDGHGTEEAPTTTASAPAPDASNKPTPRSR